MTLPADDRAKLRAWGPCAPALNRVLDELERVEATLEAALARIDEMQGEADAAYHRGQDDAHAAEPRTVACLQEQLDEAVRQRDAVATSLSVEVDGRQADRNKADAEIAGWRGEHMDEAIALRAQLAAAEAKRDEALRALKLTAGQRDVAREVYRQAEDDLVRVRADRDQARRMLAGDVTEDEAIAALFAPNIGPVGLALQVKLPQLRQTFERLGAERDAARAELKRERATLVERIDELERLYAAIGGKE